MAADVLLYFNLGCSPALTLRTFVIILVIPTYRIVADNNTAMLHTKFWSVLCDANF